MRLLRILPDRWQNLAREATSFAIIGVINTAVDFLVLNVLLWIGPLKAKVVAAVVATTLSYVMNRYWTFAKRERTSVHREYVLFFALNIIGLAIQLAVMAPVKYGFGFSEDGGFVDVLAFNIANVLGTFIAMVFRFWSYRTFVFTAPAAEATTGTVTASTQDVAITTVGVGAPADDELASEATADAFARLTLPLDLELSDQTEART